MTTPTSTPKKPPPIATHLLSHAYPAPQAAQIHLDKVLHRPIYLKPSSTPRSDTRSARRTLRRQKQLSRLRRPPKPRPLSASVKRTSGLYNLSAAECKFAVFEPLMRLWEGYVREILGMDGAGKGSGKGGRGRGLDAQAAGAKLAGADFHGMGVEVVRSRCTGRVGIGGIVVRETRGTLVVVTRGDRRVVVPKEKTVFRVRVPWRVEGKAEKVGEETKDEGKDEDDSLVFELHGDQLKYRAVDRASKKFKPHFLPDL